MEQKIGFWNKLVAWQVAKIPEKQFIYLLSLIIGIFSGMAALILKNLHPFSGHPPSGSNARRHSRVFVVSVSVYRDCLYSFICKICSKRQYRARGFKDLIFHFTKKRTIKKTQYMDFHDGKLINHWFWWFGWS